MMRLSRNACAIALFLVLVLALATACGAAEVVPSPDDRAAFALGVTKQSAVDLLQSPRACGIVMLRHHCVAVLDAFFRAAPRSAQRTKALSFARTGDLSAFDPLLSDINTTGLANQMPWNANPPATWLELAGTAYVMGTGEIGPVQDLFVAERFDGLAGHLREAGPFAALVDSETRAAISSDPQSATLTPDRAEAFRASLVPKLSELFPATAVPAMAVADGPLGDVQAGVYFSTWNELTESPNVMMEPQCRAFLQAIVNYATANGASVPQWTPERFRSAVGGARKPDEINGLYGAVQLLEASFLQHESRDRSARTIIGLYAAQGAYNAAVLRELPYDASARSFMHDAGGLDAYIPGFGAARRSALTTTSGDWVAENAALSAVVRTIVEPAR